MLPIENNNKVSLRLVLIGIAVALALGGIFLYTVIRKKEAPVYTPLHFASPRALVDQYIEGITSLETAYVIGEVPVNIDAIIFRLTDMRVPQEILDVHLRAVLTLEKMKQTPGTPGTHKQEVGELFLRLKTSATKISL